MNDSQVRIIIRVLCMTLITTALSVSAQNKVSYLIVEKPWAFTILNKYEQEVTSTDKKKFIAYSPFHILEKNTTLGDQFTKALTFTFQNQVYFILRNESGALIGAEQTGYSRMLHNCKPLNDTIKIGKNKSNLFSEPIQSKGKQFYLNKEDILVRIFQYKNEYYLLRLGQKMEYGWSRLERKSSWKTVVKQIVKKSNSLEPIVLDRIQKKISEINTTYNQFFDFFNQKSGMAKVVPLWQLNETDNKITLILKGNQDYHEHLTHSTDVLIKEIENILIGEPVQISKHKDKIFIISKPH